MHDILKQQVCQANLLLVRFGLVFDTFGNVSGVDRAAGHVVIKPSGVPYDDMRPEHMVVVSLQDGRMIEGNLRPSSDTATHLELYRAFPSAGGIAHTHSLYATAWSQAQRDLPAMGTTHADAFHGAVPCTRPLRDAETARDYEANTGKVIVERFQNLDASKVQAVLVAGHGPFAWGDSAESAAKNARMLEYLAQLAAVTFQINPAAERLPQGLLDRHYFRKHGPGTYYGQSPGGSVKRE